MGVPKFFRWLSERYPKINQRLGVLPTRDLFDEHFNDDILATTSVDADAGIVNDKAKSILRKEIPLTSRTPDPLSLCSQGVPIDRLYIDMNGILHGCSHNNSSQSGDEVIESSADITEPEIFQNVVYYLDRVVKEVAKPKSLIYLAIDGPAPRAKLNQQRSRRYRSGKEGLIEETIYDAHARNLRMKRSKHEDDGISGDNSSSDDEPPSDEDETNGSLIVEENAEQVEEVEPGRYAGKLLAHLDSESDQNEEDELFHSNYITPGTKFFSRCTAALMHFIQRKISTDPDWKNLTVVFSGPNVPGEGEHKIMQFIREQRLSKATGPLAYHANLRHCIMGQDGDLMMLGLATHEPNLVLLREQVVFDSKRKPDTIQDYVFNGCFELLHMNILRDYMSYEFETAISDDWDLEHCIDDFVFMTFFVGNDFLPHMPAMDIADEAFDLLFYTYRDARKKWLQNKKVPPYLTEAGTILCGDRLQNFLQAVGRHELMYLQSKKVDLEQDRMIEAKYGMNTIPDDEVIAEKEAADRALFRDLVQSSDQPHSGFRPVLSARPRQSAKDEDEDLSEHMGSLLRITVDGGKKNVHFDDRDVKGRYYSDKFGFSPVDAVKHIALRKEYVKGLVWNLKYYYEGCVSWDYYYPYHYGPMLSDVVGIKKMLEEIEFELGAPLRPFDQLMACMPPSFAKVLPEPYHALMTSETSEIVDFYPRSFTIDMNGKRWPWEAVVLLPFIDSKRLLAASAKVDDALLTEAEKDRNKFGNAVVFEYNEDTSFELEAAGDSRLFSLLLECKTKTTNFDDSCLAYKEAKRPTMIPKLTDGVKYPLPAYPTLRDGSVVGIWRKLLRINIHGSKSRYKTACLEIQNPVPESIPLAELSKSVIGTIVYIQYPHHVPSFVTAVSNSHGYYRGKDSEMQQWSVDDLTSRNRRLSKIVNNYVFGEKLVGTGGLTLVDGEDVMDTLDVLLYVRPFAGLRTLSNGVVGRFFAKFEIEVPLFVTGWAPKEKDPRFLNFPALLEKDPYRAASFVSTEKPVSILNKTSSVRKLVPIETSLSTNVIARAYHSLPLHRRTGWHFRNASSIPSYRRPGRTLFFHSSFRNCSTQRLAIGTFFLSWFVAAVSGNYRGRAFDTNRQGHYGRVNRSPPLQFAHGTTTLSFVFQGGIIAAVDSRASMGNFVGSKTTEKVLPINTHLLSTMAGGAADCMYWIGLIRREAELHELLHGRRMAAAQASRMLSDALYQNRNAGLSIGTMIMGFDDTSTVPTIYYVDSSGARVKGDVFAVGSGASHALGVIDKEFRHNMTVDEAIRLGIKAIRFATYRDASSGGFINVYIITETGWRRVYRGDVAALVEDEISRQGAGQAVAIDSDEQDEDTGIPLPAV